MEQSALHDLDKHTGKDQHVFSVLWIRNYCVMMILTDREKSLEFPELLYNDTSRATILPLSRKPT